MITLSNESIMQLASSNAVYARGYDLFVEDNVKHIELSTRQDGSCRVFAEVRGSMGVDYHTEATIMPSREDNPIVDYFCNCKGFEKFSGACKHVVATLLEYNYQFEDEDGSLEELTPVATPAAQGTDMELKNLVEYYVLQDRNQFCQEHGNGDVQLLPILHLESERESLELKNGITQM